MLKKVFVLLLLFVSVAQAKELHPIYGLKMKDIDEKEVSLNKYRGKVLLIVNVASRCGFTKQYKDLEKLYQKYKKEGLVILAFPCNDFGKQESGTLKEIKMFCTEKYNVTFPMFEKVKIKGDKVTTLYRHLTETKDSSVKVKWNFEKFLVSKKGEVIGHYRSKVKPFDKKLIAEVQTALK
jgi:glutathione peroxidase